MIWPPPVAPLTASRFPGPALVRAELRGAEDWEGTRLRTALGRGQSLDPDAHLQLFTGVYEALHRIARQQRARWKGNETLNATALVHEAYMKLVGGGGAY